MHMSTRIPAARLVAALLLVCVSATAAACGSSNGNGASNGPTVGGTSAAAFIQDVTTQFSRGQSGRLWSSLHPFDQAVVSRERYLACETNDGFTIEKTKVLETYADTVFIGGKATPSTAVSLQVTSDDGVTTATMHAVRVNATWRWILPPADYKAYKRGVCPAG